MLKAQSIKDCLTENTIIDIMKSLGSQEPMPIRGGGYYFNTICHNAHGKHKLRYHADTNRFYCYTNCGHLGDIFNVVCKILNCNFTCAIEYVAKFINSSELGGNSHKVDTRFINRFGHTDERSANTIYDDNILNLYENNIYHELWLRDYITIPTMQKHNIRFDVENYRIIIPIYDENNQLRGIKARKLLEQDMCNGKYGLVTIGDTTYTYNTSSLLYGLNWNKDYIKKYKTVIIGESEKFVMQHGSFYEDSIAVGLSGSYISNAQINLLMKYEVLNVILAMDKEFRTIEEQKESAEKIQKNIISKLTPYFNVSIIWDTTDLIEYKMSPTDMGEGVFKKLYNNRIFI